MVRGIKEKTEEKERLYVCVNLYFKYYTPICISSWS